MAPPFAIKKKQGTVCIFGLMADPVIASSFTLILVIHNINLSDSRNCIFL
jgi:hypothetical protein